MPNLDHLILSQHWMHKKKHKGDRGAFESTVSYSKLKDNSIMEQLDLYLYIFISLFISYNGTNTTIDSSTNEEVSDDHM